MRKKGAVCDFTQDRNRELRECFHRCLSKSGSAGMKVVFYDICGMEASRFYVSELRAERVVAYHLKYGRWMVKDGIRRRMFEEIERRVKLLMAFSKAPISFRDAIFEVVNSPAPSFYLTPRSCRTIIYALLAQRANPFATFGQIKTRA